MAKLPKQAFRFVYEIELPAQADSDAFLERLQALVAEFDGRAGGGMVGAPDPRARYRLVESIEVERDAAQLTEADVVTMTEGRKRLGIPSESGMATYVRMRRAPIVLDLAEPNPQRRNRLLVKWLKAEVRRRQRSHHR